MIRDKTKEIQDELELIAEAHGGILYPRDVVEFAKDEETALHSQFTWDDSEAADEVKAEEGGAS